jgi:hypothetical protein
MKMTITGNENLFVVTINPKAVSVMNNNLVKTIIFWEVLPCILVDGSQHFEGICCLHLQGLLH